MNKILLFIELFINSLIIRVLETSGLILKTFGRIEFYPVFCTQKPIIAGVKIQMETKILKVVRQGEAFSVQSQKVESRQIQKCNIVLRELGGSKFENEYVCSMLGSLAGCRFYEGDVVAATLRFSTHEYQGQVFQEIFCTDIVKISN